MLRSLLRVLLTRARTEHVPMRQGALEAAEAALEQPIDTRERHVPGFAILEFLEAVEVPVLVLCGGCGVTRMGALSWGSWFLALMLHRWP